MNKKECRQQARSRLASLSDADVRGRGESFARALGKRPEYRQAGTVFCFSPHGIAGREAGVCAGVHR